jgi:hypothetical protein
MKLSSLVLAVGLATLSALPAFADLTITSTFQASGRSGTATQYLAAERARTSNGDTDTIVNYSTGAVTIIDNRKKEYYETTLAEMTAMVEQLDRQLGANPLGGLLGPKVGDVNLQRVEGARKIVGYDCEHYVMTMGNDMKFDIWAAPDLQAPVQYYDAAKAPYAAMGPMGRGFGKMFEEMKKIKGFPLSTAINAKILVTKIDTLQEATQVNKDPIPASAFEPPSGYRKKDSPFKRR